MKEVPCVESKRQTYFECCPMDGWWPGFGVSRHGGERMVPGRYPDLDGICQRPQLAGEVSQVQLAADQAVVGIHSLCTEKMPQMRRRSSLAGPQKFIQGHPSHLNQNYGMRNSHNR